MGFGLADLRAVTSLRAQGMFPHPCAVAELGAQQVNESLLSHPEEIVKAGKVFGVYGDPPKLMRSAPFSPTNPLFGAPLSRSLWTWLGFDYTAVDVDNSPGNLRIDLNFDEVPPEARGRYHLVTNYGTTEHALNQLQAFKIIHDLTALGGVMIHNVPAPSLPDHGYVMSYTPKFFWALGEANAYTTLFMSLFPADPQPLANEIIEHMARYDPSISDRLRNYRTAECGLVVVLRKQYEHAFVPPLDFPPGTTTDDDTLRMRYLTTFNPATFAHALKWKGSRPYKRVLRHLRNSLMRPFNSRG